MRGRRLVRGKLGRRTYVIERTNKSSCCFCLAYDRWKEHLLLAWSSPTSSRVWKDDDFFRKGGQPLDFNNKGGQPLLAKGGHPLQQTVGGPNRNWCRDSRKESSRLFSKGRCGQIWRQIKNERYLFAVVMWWRNLQYPKIGISRILVG